MNKQNKVKALVLALGLMSLAGLARAEFAPGMTAQQVAQEVTAQLKAGKGLEAIAKAAHDAGLQPEQVASSLISAGQNPAAVVTALIKANPDAAVSITAAAVTMEPAQAAAITAAAVAAAPQQRQAITTAALTVPGVNPGEVLAATAAGRNESRGNAGRGEDREGRREARATSTPSAAGGGGHRASAS